MRAREPRLNNIKVFQKHKHRRERKRKKKKKKKKERKGKERNEVYNISIE